jgi:hypothetical protein
MNESITKLVLVAFVASSASACAARSGLGAPNHTYVVQRIDGPYVQAGTQFDVELEQPLAADGNQPGDEFVARVTTPLRAPNGHDVVRVGARVTGKVVDAVAGAALALKFDGIETVRGPTAVHATVQSAGAYASVAPLPPTIPLSPAEVDAFLRPSPGRAIGGGPPEPGVPRVLAPVRIPARAVVHMALLDPLVPPGVRVEIPPRRPPRPAYNEPPYKSNIVAPSNPLDQISP